ncbi:MAG: hypothetical protein ABIH52_01295, partial [Candidatus Aenigmatarchaeota archaeon]
MSEKEHKTERSPWMYTTIILAIVSLGLLASNIQSTAFISSLDGGTTALAVNPTQAVPAQPTQPTTPPPPPAIQGDLTDDDAVKGDPNAPITIVEFSDFE